MREIRTSKKAQSILVALALGFSICNTAFAATQDVNTGTDVKNETIGDGQTYSTQNINGGSAVLKILITVRPQKLLFIRAYRILMVVLQ
jgi:hypothetical protein